MPDALAQSGNRAAALLEVAEQLEATAARETELSSSDYDQESYAASRLREEATRLRHKAAQEQPAEAHAPSHTWTVESPRRDNWASWGTNCDDRDWALERYESAASTAPQRHFRLVRATTTYVVEAEHTPRTGPEPREAP